MSKITPKSFACNFADDLEDLQKEWEEEIHIWREEDFPTWKDTFEEYKDGHSLKEEL